MLSSASIEPAARDAITKLRLKAQFHKDELISLVAEVYASAYSPDNLKALVDFLESPAGNAMRERQPEVEQRIKKVTNDFLQRIRDENR